MDSPNQTVIILHTITSINQVSLLVKIKIYKKLKVQFIILDYCKIIYLNISSKSNSTYLSINSSFFRSIL